MKKKNVVIDKTLKSIFGLLVIVVLALIVLGADPGHIASVISNGTFEGTTATTFAFPGNVNITTGRLNVFNINATGANITTLNSTNATINSSIFTNIFSEIINSSTNITTQDINASRGRFDNYLSANTSSFGNGFDYSYFNTAGSLQFFNRAAYLVGCCTNSSGYAFKFAFGNAALYFDSFTSGAYEFFSNNGVEQTTITASNGYGGAVGIGVNGRVNPLSNILNVNCDKKSAGGGCIINFTSNILVGDGRGNESIADYTSNSRIAFNYTNQTFLNKNVTVEGDAYAQKSRFLPQLIYSNISNSSITGTGFIVVRNFTIPAFLLTNNTLEIEVYANRSVGIAGGIWRVGISGNYSNSLTVAAGNNPVLIRAMIIPNITSTDSSGFQNRKIIYILEAHTALGQTGAPYATDNVQQSITIELDLATDTNVWDNHYANAEVKQWYSNSII